MVVAGTLRPLLGLLIGLLEALIEIGMLFRKCTRATSSPVIPGPCDSEEEEEEEQVFPLPRPLSPGQMAVRPLGPRVVYSEEDPEFQSE